MLRLVAEFLKEIAPFCFERRGIGKNGNGKWKRREIAQAFERMFKRSARRAVLHILIEIQIRQGRDDQHVSGELHKLFRNTPNELGQLKTGKGARDPNQIVERGWFEAAPSGKASDEQRTDLVRPVQIQDPFLAEQDPRKEVM